MTFSHWSEDRWVLNTSPFVAGFLGVDIRSSGVLGITVLVFDVSSSGVEVGFIRLIINTGLILQIPEL